MEHEVIRKAETFMELLERVNDPRDNRGKRHKLSFVLACVIVAILSNKSYMSSIHRFIQHRIEWLKDIFHCPEATAVSRAQLPKIIEVVDWTDVNACFQQFFPLPIQIVTKNGEWTAFDGKSLKGTIVDPTQAHKHERIVCVVTHTSHEVLCQQRFSGEKESEVTVVRDLLETTGLVSGKVSLDAGHANPTTFSQIHQANGRYVVQIKQNQPLLFETLAEIAEQIEQVEQTEQTEQIEQVEQVEQTEQTEQTEQSEFPTTGVTIMTVDKGHGRLEERVGRVLSLPPGVLAERWKPTGMQTLIVMDRRTEDLKTGKTSAERSYYVSNQGAPDHERELFDAIRGHWGVESTNYIRDVTLNEDHTRTRNANQGQILSLLRTVALKFVQKLQPSNVKATLEEFADVPGVLHDILVRFKFLSVS